MQPDRTTHIAVLGDINADITLIVPSYPAEGDDCTAQTLRWGSGGAALNAAATFALLGGKVRLFGRVGVDPAAEVALHQARQAGVDISAVQVDHTAATGMCTAVISADGQRTFFSFRGANLFFDPAAVTSDVLNRVHLLYLSAYALLEGSQRVAALQAVELAHAHQVPIVLDLGPPVLRRCRDDILQLLPRLWLLCLNEDELRLLVPDQPRPAAIATLLAGGAGHVALKQGAQGCTLATASHFLELPPPPVTAVDTTGCGDAFAAGCAWALLHLSSIHECAVLGNLLGALTATRPGAADALPTRAELLRWLDPSLRHLLTLPRHESI